MDDLTQAVGWVFRKSLINRFRWDNDRPSGEHHWEPVYTADQLLEAIKQAVLAEREACAKVAETPIVGEQNDMIMEAKDRVADTIRARSQA